MSFQKFSDFLCSHKVEFWGWGKPLPDLILVFHLITCWVEENRIYPISWMSTGLLIADREKVIGVFSSGHTTPKWSARMEKSPFFTDRTGNGRCQFILKLFTLVLLSSSIMGSVAYFQGQWWGSSVKQADYHLLGVDSRKPRSVALRPALASGWLAKAGPHPGLAWATSPGGIGCAIPLFLSSLIIAHLVLYVRYPPTYFFLNRTTVFPSFQRVSDCFFRAKSTLDWLSVGFFSEFFSW